MGRNNKKGENKIAAKKALYCLVATVVVFANGASASALDSTDISTNINQNQITLGGRNEVLIDKNIKFYSDINKVKKLSGFDFKLLDYAFEDSQISSYQVHKISDTNNAVEIFFDNENSEKYSMYSVIAFQGDPIEVLKTMDENHNSINKDYKVDVSNERASVSGVNGRCITFTITMPERASEGSSFQETKNIQKYFVWKDDGVSYAIDYDNSYVNREKVSKFINISQDELKKMVTSLKPLDEIKNIDYLTNLRENQELSTECGIMDIYDKEDLKQAQSIIGFNPKMPLKIKEGIEINSSCVGITSDSNIKNNNIYYELDSFYSNKNGSITFNQSNHDTFNNYEDIKNNGYVIREDWVTGAREKVNVEKINVNGVEVLKYKESSSENGCLGESNNTLFYVWKEDKVYCGLVLFGTNENTDDIAKEFVKSTPIE